MHDQNEHVVYEFDGFRVDVLRRKLLSKGVTLQLTAKAFDTLVFLIRHQGSTVTKADLMNAVWEDSAVEENNLTQQISALRRVLGERPNDHRFIVTVPGRGYCFVSELRRATGGSRTRPGPHFDAAVLRGYSVAMAEILLVGLAFLWFGMSDAGTGKRQSLAVLNFKV